MSNKKPNLFSTLALICGIGSIVSLCFGFLLTFMLAPLIILSIIFALLAATEGKIDLTGVAKMSVGDAIKYKLDLIKKADQHALIGVVLAFVALGLTIIGNFTSFIANLISAGISAIFFFL